MSMHAATEQLWRAAHRLRDEVHALRLQAVEDRPRNQPNKLVDDLGVAVETLAGWAEELVDGAARAVAARDLPALRRSLDTCTDGMDRLGTQLYAELVSTARIDEMGSLAREGRPELKAWVGVLKRALDEVNQSLWTVQSALTTCWRELADRAVPEPMPATAPPPADTTRRT